MRERVLIVSERVLIVDDGPVQRRLPRLGHE
jgi:hypothetical protein